MSLLWRGQIVFCLVRQKFLLISGYPCGFHSSFLPSANYYEAISDSKTYVISALLISMLRRLFYMFHGGPHRSQGSHDNVTGPSVKLLASAFLKYSAEWKYKLLSITSHIRSSAFSVFHLLRVSPPSSHGVVCSCFFPLIACQHLWHARRYRQAKNKSVWFSNLTLVCRVQAHRLCDFCEDWLFKSCIRYYFVGSGSYV